MYFLLKQDVGVGQGEIIQKCEPMGDHQGREHFPFFLFSFIIYLFGWDEWECSKIDFIGLRLYLHPLGQSDVTTADTLFARKLSICFSAKYKEKKNIVHFFKCEHYDVENALTWWKAICGFIVTLNSTKEGNAVFCCRQGSAAVPLILMM